MTDPVTIITDLFNSEGAADYLGEPVTQAAHMLQAAALAERAGAPGALVAAALLHDVGHFTGTVTGRALSWPRSRPARTRPLPAGSAAGPTRPRIPRPGTHRSAASCRCSGACSRASLLP